MFRPLRLKSVVVPLAALVAVLALAPGASAQVKPFKVTGSGLAPDGVAFLVGDPRPHWAVGQATELGRYYGEGQVVLDRFTGPATAEFSSAVPFVFVAPNGDKLAFTYGDTDNGAEQPGQVALFPRPGGRFVAVFVAEFNPVPELCTGRFASVIDGSFIMTAVTDPFVLGSSDPAGYSWSGEGWIEFKKGK
jgi:hypothetical protein